MAAGTHRGRHGFTLIEILAVVLIIGLTFGFFLPNLDSARYRRLEDRAGEVAALLHVARERAIVTGAPHRLWLHVEDGAMRVDWYVDEERAARSDANETEPALELDPALGDPGRAEVSLFPPESSERTYYPIPTRFGRLDYLPRDYFFVGVDTPDGFVDMGEVQLVFGRNGTTDYAEIVLADAWENQVVLEIQPLMNRVRIHRDGDG